MSKRLVVEPKNSQGWEILPEGADLRCGRCEFGSVIGKSGERQLDRPKVDPDQCERRAVWIKRGTCSCGKCDMTRRYCSECLVVELMEECARRDETIDGAVTLIREYDREFASRRMVLLKICGVDQHPSDPPDEYWKSCHQGKIS